MYQSNTNVINYLIAIIIFFYALWNLRVEIRLILDHLTIMSLFYALSDHPFSFICLILTPIILFNQMNSIKKKK